MRVWHKKSLSTNNHNKFDSSIQEMPKNSVVRAAFLNRELPTLIFLIKEFQAQTALFAQAKFHNP